MPVELVMCRSPDGQASVEIRPPAHAGSEPRSCKCGWDAGGPNTGGEFVADGDSDGYWVCESTAVTPLNAVDTARISSSPEMTLTRWNLGFVRRDHQCRDAGTHAITCQRSDSTGATTTRWRVPSGAVRSVR
jgi:hypothetical protein